MFVYFLCLTFLLTLFVNHAQVSSFIRFKCDSQFLTRVLQYHFSSNASAEQTLPTTGVASGTSTDGNVFLETNNFRPEEHTGMLGITFREPPSPEVPAEFDIISGEAAKVKTYIVALQKRQVEVVRVFV